MEPERYRQIREIAHEALDIAPGERAALKIDDGAARLLVD